MPTPSAHYSYGQLEGLWISQGGPSRLAPLMAAIAMAESGGNARAYNSSGASGLWQILGKPFPGNAFDPMTNARMAVAKWKSQGLNAWVTYTSGAWRRFFRRGVAPVQPGGGEGGGVPVLPYRNPFRSVTGLRPERIDMGVDVGGSGPVYALGKGVITAAQTGTGWGPPRGVAPGGFIGERLAEGPLKGHYVYLAEGVVPQVKPGQRVTAGTVIGRLTGGGIETGLAAPPGTGGALAAQLGQIPGSGDPGAVPTAAGVAYARLLHAVGTPTVPIPKTGTGAFAPGWPPPWLAGIWAGLFGTPGGPVPTVPGSGIAQAIQGIANWLNGLTTAVDWLLNPVSWVRIIAGVGGGVMVITGVGVLSHVGGQVPVPGTSGSVSARPAALPVGILLVGAGSVGLFVAFHNLDAANIGELLGALRDRMQAASPVAAEGGGGPVLTP